MSYWREKVSEAIAQVIASAVAENWDDRFTKETDCCYAFGYLYDELINSDLLCRDEEDEEFWIECEPWLKIVCQKPLKVEENI